MIPNDPITPGLVEAYTLCQRKAFLLLRGDTGAAQHEYLTLIDAHASKSLNSFLEKLRSKGIKIQRGEERGAVKDADAISQVTLKTKSGDLEGTIDALVRVQPKSSQVECHYEPHLVVGTYTITTEQKIRLAFIGHLLSEVLHYRTETGSLVNVAGDISRIQLRKLITGIRPIVDTLKAWKNHLPPSPPSIILNNHCPLCPFRNFCREQAAKEDNLSLLSRMTPKAMRKYHKKGIFTVAQLSYLFKPRRQRRRRASVSSVFKLELQALSLRTGKVYIDQPPSIPADPIELFLDIEGVPDHHTHYLIGLIVSASGRIESHSLWADTVDKERDIFEELLRITNEHPGCSIYHYGSYELKAIDGVAKKYGFSCDSITSRLVNVNSFVFGKVYFPTRSNTLKDLGTRVGATWSSPNPSGLQSVVWRLQWEVSRDCDLKARILAYNLEDCQALRLLLTELRNIGQTADARADVDFADIPKQIATTAGQRIHNSLEGLLMSAHGEYRRNRIGIRKMRGQIEKGDIKRGAPKGHVGYQRAIPTKTDKVTRVRRRTKCPRHREQLLNPSEKVAQRTVIDLLFTKKGCKKTVIKYVGRIGYCPLCYREYLPPGIKRLTGHLFGRCFRAWAVYQRITLRLPYEVISQVIEELFCESVSAASVVHFITDFAEYYSWTETILLNRILQSPFIHVDETKINIRGIDQYVWVFTDGIRVVYKLTETREAILTHDILNGYAGILVSDFYAGYDSCSCRQQKCLVHLIRDLNDDLWGSPYDLELEAFVGDFKDLLVAIMADVDKYGLKRRHLYKHRPAVGRFYNDVIFNRVYQGEGTQKFQKRFIRYRESLFRFLEEDEILWNNNMAERAFRSVQVQRNISGHFFTRGAVAYLQLLGIAQTCVFQNKSFLRFLISGKKDVDQFTERKRRRSSMAIFPSQGTEE